MDYIKEGMEAKEKQKAILRNESYEPIPRYNVASISTKDLELIRLRSKIKGMIPTITDEAIYKEGLIALEKGIK